jgi:hypothetical protein
MSEKEGKKRAYAYLEIEVRPDTAREREQIRRKKAS